MILLSGGIDGGTTSARGRDGRASGRRRPQGAPRRRLRAAGHLRRQQGRARRSSRSAWRSKTALKIVRQPAARAGAREPHARARHDPRAVHGARDGARAGLQEADDLVAGADHADARARSGSSSRRSRSAEKINVVGVDIGGATTDVFSVFQDVFNRTVSANLGMSYSRLERAGRGRAREHPALGAVRDRTRPTCATGSRTR